MADHIPGGDHGPSAAFQGYPARHHATGTDLRPLQVTQDGDVLTLPRGMVPNPLDPLLLFRMTAVRKVQTADVNPSGQQSGKGFLGGAGRSNSGHDFSTTVGVQMLAS